jgi:hypothetical protein
MTYRGWKNKSTFLVQYYAFFPSFKIRKKVQKLCEEGNYKDAIDLAIRETEKLEGDGFVREQVARSEVYKTFRAWFGIKMPKGRGYRE